MAYDPCAPFPETGSTASVTPKHHLAHHVIGRIRHRVHHTGGHALHPHVAVAEACGKPMGALPALPGGRLSLSSALPKGAVLGKALGAASALALAGAVTAGVAVLPLSSGSPAGRSTMPAESGTPSSGPGDTAGPGAPGGIGGLGGGGGSGAPVIVAQGSPGATTPRAPVAGPVPRPAAPSPVSVPEPPSALLLAVAAAAALGARCLLARPRQHSNG